MNAWKDIQNIEHGFTDPNDPANKRLMAQRDNLSREIKDARQAITDGLQALVIEGMITNRADVIQALTSSGFEIARETDKAISIKNPAGKRNIRLTGGLYERDFNYSFMTAKLEESETIIKQGMESLDTSNEQLLTMLATHQTDMSTALETYTNNVQAHTTEHLEHLEQFAEEMERTIEAYTQHIAQLSVLERPQGHDLRVWGAS